MYNINHHTCRVVHTGLFTTQTNEYILIVYITEKECEWDYDIRQLVLDTWILDPNQFRLKVDLGTLNVSPLSLNLNILLHRSDRFLDLRSNPI